MRWSRSGRGIKVLPIEKIKCEVWLSKVWCAQEQKVQPRAQIIGIPLKKKKRNTVTVDKVNTVLLTKKSECENDDVMNSRCKDFSSAQSSVIKLL